MDIITGILGLLDGTISALLGHEVLSLFLASDLLFAVLGLFLLIKEAAGDRRRRR